MQPPNAFMSRRAFRRRSAPLAGSAGRKPGATGGCQSAHMGRRGLVDYAQRAVLQHCALQPAGDRCHSLAPGDPRSGAAAPDPDPGRAQSPAPPRGGLHARVLWQPRAALFLGRDRQCALGRHPPWRRYSKRRGCSTRAGRWSSSAPMPARKWCASRRCGSILPAACPSTTLCILSTRLKVL